MIYRRFKTHSLTLVGVFILGTFLLPQFAFAAGRAQTNTVTKTNFCSSIDQTASKMKKAMQDKETLFFTKENERKLALDEKIARQDTERQNTRFTWDNSRDKVYTLLSGRASSGKEKKALVKFRSSIDEAVEVRRKSVDSATSLFKTKVGQVVKDRKIMIEKATSLFGEQADSALQEAKTDCSNGVSSIDAREAYIEKLGVAQNGLKTSFNQIKESEALRNLIKERQSAIEQASKEFKATVNKAEEELKKAFPGA